MIPEMVCASEGDDPNDTNHTPLRTMTFTFSTRSTQTSSDFQGDKAKISTNGLKQIEYIDKFNIGSINERGADDLTGASYVMDTTSSWGKAVKCEVVAQMAGATFGTAIAAAGSMLSGGAATPVAWVIGQRLGASLAKIAMRGACLDEQAESRDHLKGMIEKEIIDTISNTSNEDVNDSPTNDRGDEGGNDDGDEGDNGDGNNGDGNNGDGDGGDGDGDGSNGDGNQGEEADSAPAEEQQPTDEDKGTDGEAGGDEGNPNPYADGSQGSTSKPTIGPAPGDIGGRYNNMFNPGAERGFTPGDDGGDGNPGNPWDRNERMSTPNDNGDPIDPLTGFGGPSGPQVDDGNPINPDEDYDSSGPGDDLWKPNPDDIWGGGPTSKIVGSIQIEDDKSMAKFVDAMSTDLAIF